MDVVSRKEALEKKLKAYFTGKPCKKGHISERYAKGGHCLHCSKERTEYLKNWYTVNKERVLLEDKLYYKQNKEQILRRNKKYLISYRKNHKISIREKEKQYKLNNRSKVYANNAKRRALKLRAMPRWTDLVAIENIYANCPKGYHVDHIIPLQNDLVCGLHVENNLQYLTKKENLEKSNKFTPVNYCK